MREDVIPSVLSIPAVTHYAAVSGPPADKSSAWSSISVKGANMWNDMSADNNNFYYVRKRLHLEKCTKLYFCNHITLFNFCFVNYWILCGLSSM